LWENVPQFKPSGFPSASVAPVDPQPTRLIEKTALRAVKPIVRWLIRKGVTFQPFAEGLKQVFLDEARQEWRSNNPEALAKGKQPTDSALSLLSGVHRRDIRELRAEPEAEPERLGLAAQVYARWLSSPRFLDEQEVPLALLREEFDALAASVSSDVRPRAVLDQLLRTQAVVLVADRYTVNPIGFTPKADWEAMSANATDNSNDHLRAIFQNLDDQSNWLEQAIFSDEMTQASVDELHAAVAHAWRQNHRKLMQLAQRLYERDLKEAPAPERQYRARLGMYFYAEPDQPKTPNKIE
jgi:hypothetical protein